MIMFIDNVHILKNIIFYNPKLSQMNRNNNTVYTNLKSVQISLSLETI